ncbi:hypothetical protein JZ751_021592 [Albula glossodonta]|uniref:Uncharacterized protein n=1 Tax=Albula glossodonta TaxID=121402 RepID=A0A8T2NJR4_9TELE|nr:hypothetical protein JZ751_021592 [Albula glossodonta]
MEDMQRDSGWEEGGNGGGWWCRCGQPVDYNCPLQEPKTILSFYLREVPAGQVTGLQHINPEDKKPQKRVSAHSYPLLLIYHPP